MNLKLYIENLSKEIQNSLSTSYNSELVLDCDEIQLNMTKAIPCGLILNELITNSFKYAQQEDKLLKIEISLKEKNKLITLSVRDNSPGFQMELMNDTSKLGIELITSLAEQIDATYSFENRDELQFSMHFLA